MTGLELSSPAIPPYQRHGTPGNGKPCPSLQEVPHIAEDPHVAFPKKVFRLLGPNNVRKHAPWTTLDHLGLTWLTSAVLVGSFWGNHMVCHGVARNHAFQPKFSIVQHEQKHEKKL